MKLLFDQNLSPWLVQMVESEFPQSIHVRQVNLQNATDAVIWEYAATNGFAIVTKDSDFRQRSFTLGHPPKVIWLRLGNCATERICQLLVMRAAEIRAFLMDEEKAFLGLS